MRLEPGVVVKGFAGAYTCGPRVGEGGFGLTFAGTDRDGSEVLLKELRIERLRDWKALELFEREAAALEHLSHDRIPAYRDFFAWDGERAIDVKSSSETTDEGADVPSLILVQERIDGATLATLMDEKRRMTADAAERLLREMLEILRYLHELHPPVIHRDINPQNVLMDAGGAAYLIDFGAVQDRLRLSSDLGSTQVGTLGFMPMEQLAGATQPSSDLYALGLTVLCVLTHHLPHELLRDDSSMCLDVDNAVPMLPARVRAVLAAMTGPTPADRVASAADALAMLDEVVVSSPEGASGRRKSAAWAGIAVAAIALLAGAFAVYTLRFGGSSLATPSPRPATDAIFNPYFGRVALVNANDDDFVDIVGKGHTAGDHPFAIDGRTGELMWQSPAVGDGDFFANGEDMVLSVGEEEVDALNRTDGALLWSLKLPDVLEGVRYGAGCVELRAIDKSTTAVDAVTGEVRACPHPLPAPHNTDGWKDAPGPKARMHGLSLKMSATDVGTKRAVLTAKRGDDEVWTRDLPQVDVDTRYASMPKHILVAGKDRLNGNDGFWLYLLEPTTGEVRLERKVSTTRSVHRLSVFTRGATIVISHSGVMYAFDHELEPLWKVGRST